MIFYYTHFQSPTQIATYDVFVANKTHNDRYAPVNSKLSSCRHWCFFSPGLRIGCASHSSPLFIRKHYRFLTRRQIAYVYVLTERYHMVNAHYSRRFLLDDNDTTQGSQCYQLGFVQGKKMEERPETLMHLTAHDRVQMDNPVSICPTVVTGGGNEVTHATLFDFRNTGTSICVLWYPVNQTDRWNAPVIYQCRIFLVDKSSSRSRSSESFYLIFINTKLMTSCI